MKKKKLTFKDKIKSLSLTKKIIGIVTICIFIGACAGFAFYGINKDSYGVKVTDSSKKIVTGDITITKQNYFNYLLKTYGSDNVITDALNEIAKKEVKENAAFKKELKTQKETYASYSTDGLDAYAKEAGYKDADDFVDNYLKPQVRLTMLVDNYINKHLKSLLSKYDVCSFKMITVEKESTALKIIDKATTEDKFDEYMAKDDYKDNAEDVGVVTKNSTSLDSNLIKKLDAISKSKDGIYKSAIKLSDDTYAVVFVYDHAHKDTDTYVSTLSSDTEIQEYIKGVYLKKYNFKVYSKKLKKEIKSTYSNYID